MEKRLTELGTVIKCHRSYLVNLQHVSMVLKEELVLDNQEKIPLSRNLRKAANAAVVAECGNVDFFHAVVCEQETEQISE